MGIFVLFNLWSETRLIKYEGIEAPAERPQFYNAIENTLKINASTGSSVLQ